MLVPIHQQCQREQFHPRDKGAFVILGDTKLSPLIQSGIALEIQHVASTHIPPCSANKLTLAISLKWVKLISPFSTLS